MCGFVCPPVDIDGRPNRVSDDETNLGCDPAQFLATVTDHAANQPDPDGSSQQAGEKGIQSTSPPNQSGCNVTQRVHIFRDQGELFASHSTMFDHGAEPSK